MMLTLEVIVISIAIAETIFLVGVIVAYLMSR